MKDSSIAIVKSLVPVLEDHGTAVCQKMFDILFEETPAALRFFSLEFCRSSGIPVPQMEGTGCPFAAENGHTGGSAKTPIVSDQAKRLAEAVLAYCANVDNLAALSTEVQRIVAVHVSRGVEKPHYDLVGEALIKAVKAVLGGAATDEIVDALGEAYGVLAEVFVEKETAYRAQLGARPGGWEGFRTFRVSQRQEEDTGKVVCVTVEPVDEGKVIGNTVGQYTCIRWKDSEHGELKKKVLLTGAKSYQPHTRETYEFRLLSVTDKDDIISSDNLLFDAAVPDALLDLSPPCGGALAK